jgi:hypothetical protein
MVFDNNKWKIIVWGHKLHSHTHSYIHYGFYRAAKYMGYETYWMDDKDTLSDIDNCIFLTEGQVDNKIPQSNNSKYILHNCNGIKYEWLKQCNRINMQFFSTEAFKYNLSRSNDYTYLGDDIVQQCWATDLLPNEIDENNARNEINNRECVWIGSYDQGDKSQYENNTELDPFFDECRRNNIRVRTINPWINPCSPEENRQIVNKAFLAPAINGLFQKQTYYIPCRIFKNISYGHFGITNNEYVNKIFDNRLIYSGDTRELFYKSLEKKNSDKAIEDIKYLMNEVKNKHTYINRLQVLLDQLDKR